ncbi:MAG: hypothetical protein ACTJGD_07140 [Mesonia hippocampi]|uniref:hypothetical protein n=1 Tax=Mesonia hippocampi TaxID=1628250 RepID=UPI003F9B4F4A
MNLKTRLNYLAFLKKSTNQHGVHSPFVFSLVTQCFYAKKNTAYYQNLCKNNEGKLSKTNKKIIKLLDYFSVKNLSTNIINFPPLNGVNNIPTTSLTNTEEKKIDAFLLTTLSINTSLWQDILKHSHNDSLVILTNIHQKHASNIWQELCKRPEVKVSIDCFSLGILFFRKEQAKEHFTIRW